MRVDRYNIVNHELIGLDATVVKGANRDIIGVKGRIIDESRNLFVLDSRGGEKKVVKYGNTFEFTLPDNDKVTLDGIVFVGRPEDRVAKRPPHSRNR